MKPSWDDAPTWAQWLAMNKSGNWFWFEYKPHAEIMFTVFIRSSRYRDSRCELAAKCCPPYEENRGWMHTRERRNDGIRKV